MGGLVGAALAHEGDRVTLLVRPQTHTQHPGMLRLKRPYDTIEVPVRIETMLADPVDVLWVAVKAHQLVAALRAVPPDLVTTTIVPLLNGIEHVNLLRLCFNHERVVPARIPNALLLVGSSNVLHLSAWHFQCWESTNWRASPRGFGMRAFRVNSKRMKKPCCGASSPSSRRSLL